MGSLISRWRERRERRQDLEALGEQGRESLAHDIGVPDHMLDRLIGDRLRFDFQLEPLLAAVGLNPDALRRKHPKVVLDMEVVCAQCDRARKCRRALEQGNARANFEKYCPNALTITSLLGNPI